MIFGKGQPEPDVDRIAPAARNIHAYWLARRAPRERRIHAPRLQQEVQALPRGAGRRVALGRENSLPQAGNGLLPPFNFLTKRDREHHVTRDPWWASSSLRSGLGFRYTQRCDWNGIRFELLAGPGTIRCLPLDR
jgi:hypothetical protein